METNVYETNNWNDIACNWKVALVRVAESISGHSFVLFKEKDKFYILQSYVQTLSIRRWLKDSLYFNDIADNIIKKLSAGEFFSNTNFGILQTNFPIKNCKLMKNIKSFFN